MKELSIEEKAKRYDEAIEKARSKIKNDKDHVLYEDDVIEIFPELKESEDEITRKELIDFVKSRLAGFPQCEKFVAWLEAQGEQKLTDKEIKELLRTEYEKGRADAIAEMQKPWSEEDEKIINGITSYLCTHDSCELDGFDKWYDFLKSLKDRVQSQQEKERILGKLEEWLDEYISNLADVGTDTLIGSFRKYLDGKLPVKPKSQWKPSDTEINILQGVIDGSFKPENVKVTLTNILEQLKKLKNG